MRILRPREVTARTGLSRSTIWRRMRDGRFPLCVQVGANSIGWYEHEITAWCEALTRGNLGYQDLNCNRGKDVAA